ncbi:T9SS type B sorting domain-containing protein [Hyunsoonleella rubra]|uniref:T9SS type B sorting domain-containing protein n=1 Tax=Hyunsoonleella rubra TaxID=1737062 RepID=A0ABW5TBA1_9FLAO
MGFCSGSSGDPIYKEDFGTGVDNAILSSGTTTYAYANGRPLDGFYTLSSFTRYFTWFDVEDHTPNDVNGRSMLVNADNKLGEFIRVPVSGLCEKTTYEFSSWMLNLVPLNASTSLVPIPVNVTFQVWDDTETNLLASGNTGDIHSTIAPVWREYGLVFQTFPGQTSIVLKIINNGEKGFGNDLALDDIEFKACGDITSISDGVNNRISVCSSQIPYATIISANSDGSVYSSHFYQWQKSNDGINWIDIPGANNQSVSVSGINSSTFYRTKVAEVESNLSNDKCYTISDVFEVEIIGAPPKPVLECWESASFNDTTCSWEITGSKPEKPAIDCWQTATFNSATCLWEVTGSQPPKPLLQCYESASFNSSTCSWDVTGTRPTQPVIDCWESATFNATTCVWEVKGSQPPQPDLECWESANFNTTSCSWEVTGSQPDRPVIDCWEIASFNNATCIWEVTGEQPAQPVMECWESAIFNNSTCSWDVVGTHPDQPVINCWETTAFNDTTCIWEVFGTQPVQPSLECWESAVFNDTSCSWDVSGTKPHQPILNCWQTTTFNEATCVWDVQGEQPDLPDMECWETATFNHTNCSWDVSGDKPEPPILECWETTEFNNSSCEWDILGTKPEAPALECWETAAFDSDQCAWQVSGLQPDKPVAQECWEVITFNNVTCEWEIAGTKPLPPTLECWQTTIFDDVTCSWAVSGTKTEGFFEEDIILCATDTPVLFANTTIPNPTYLWSTGAQTDAIPIDKSGSFFVEVSNSKDCVFETTFFDVTFLEEPEIEKVYSDGNDIVVSPGENSNLLYSLDGRNFQTDNVFYNVEGGPYTIHVKNEFCDGTVTTEWLHFFVPKFFTPNNDGYHDTFSLQGIEEFGSFQVSVFDRYGKLLKNVANTPFEWDGTFKNQLLPTGDYWYVIVVEGRKITGHITLKR